LNVSWTALTAADFAARARRGLVLARAGRILAIVWRSGTLDRTWAGN
jgi:hypothetical protein